jgi:hypothetical protein
LKVLPSGENVEVNEPRAEENFQMREPSTEEKAEEN